MKVWLYLLLGLGIFIIFGAATQHHLKTSSQELAHQLDQIESLIKAENWDQSITELDSLKKTWDKTKSTWALLTHHQEIDLVEQSLIKTIEAAFSQSYPDVRMELGTLRHFLTHIYERERLSLVNIF